MYGISKTCTACGLCLDKCPESAIRLVENERRELVSFIDNDKCIKCGLCSNICPEINHNKFKKSAMQHGQRMREIIQQQVLAVLLRLFQSGV